MFLLVRTQKLYLLLEDLRIRWTPDWERGTKFHQDSDLGVLIRPVLERMVPHVVMERHDGCRKALLCDCVNHFGDTSYHSDHSKGMIPILSDGICIGSLSLI